MIRKAVTTVNSRGANHSRTYLADPAFEEVGNVVVVEHRQKYHCPDAEQIRRSCAAILAAKYPSSAGPDGEAGETEDDGDEAEAAADA